jgi:hypothetical protein
MDTKRPAENSELVTDGVLPVQALVTRAIPLPPGTPARPRPNRPALSAREANALPPDNDGARQPGSKGSDQAVPGSGPEGERS